MSSVDEKTFPKRDEQVVLKSFKANVKVGISLDGQYQEISISSLTRYYPKSRLNATLQMVSSYFFDFLENFVN